MAKKKVFQISDRLTEGLEETIYAGNNYSGELRIEVIPIKRIEVDPENPRDLCLTFDDLYHRIDPSDAQHERKFKELESLQSIAHSIREQGIINPIVVYKFGEKYRLVAGERRTLASIVAGKSEIQAKILENKPNELKISLLQWIENVERSDLTLSERLRNLEKIVEAYAAKKSISMDQVTITELSNLIGCSKPHAMNYKSVLMADTSLKQLIHENQIRNLEKAALLSDIKSFESQQYAINACLAGASLKKLKIIADQEFKKSVTPKVAVKRGRQAQSVNFGGTKNLHVAKVIVNSVLENESLKHFASYFEDTNWNDYKAVSETFKNLLNKLEELHG